MEYVTLDLVKSLGTIERRTCARLAVSSLIFVKLGDGNGGIAFNISEGGLALSAANGLPGGQLPKLSIQLPDSGDWIQTTGQISWLSNSNKECGVRFVGMDEEARRRIREWIAQEMSSASPAPNPESNSAFQKLELNNTAPTSGDNVVFMKKEDRDASDAAPAAEVADHGARQPMPSESEAAPVDATAFREEKDENIVVAKGGMLPAPVFPANPYHAEAVLDRRVHPRKRIIPLGYVQLGDENGGIALNVSEGGLSITAANPLPEDHLLSIRFQFPGDNREVDAKGEIVWRSESKKEAGIRFVELTEEARLQLRNQLWSPAPLLAVECQAVECQTEPIVRGERNGLPLTAPSEPELCGLRPIPDSSPTHKAPEKGPESPPHVAGICSDVSSVPAPDPGVESHARSQPVKRHLEVIRVRIKGGVRAWTAAVAVLMLVGLVPFIRHRLSSRQGAQPMVDVIPPKPHGAKAAQVAPQSSPVNVASASQPHWPDSRQELNRNPESPKNSAAVDVPIFPLKDLAHRVHPAQHPLAAKASKDPVRRLRESTGLNQGTGESLPAPVSVTNPVLPGEQAAAESVRPSPLAQKEVRLVPSPMPDVSPPANTELAGSGNKSIKSGGEGASLPERTEPAGRISGRVAITTDPYPSIRFSGKPNGKKSRSGTSLHLGQLVSRFEPPYPVEAMQKGVQGTVKIHVIVSPEGSIEHLVSVDGPPLLVPATMRAVQQWRYSPTLLGGQPVETEDNIAVTFGLSTETNR